MPQPDQKIALVTGASSGIGRAAARALAGSGFRVFGTTRHSPDALRGEPFEPLRMDVDDAASVSSAVDEIVERAGRLDLVVSCAGFGIAGAIEDTSDDEAAAIFETNLFGTLRVCRAALPIMRRQRSGTIIHVSSIAGRIALPFQGMYSATKFAVEGMTEALRMEVKRFGIRVVLIEPGDFATGFTDRRVRVRASRKDPTYADALARALGVAEKDERSGPTPEPIGRLVVRIATARTPRCRYTVGPVFQRAAVRLKSVLPSRIFEWGLRTYYRIDE